MPNDVICCENLDPRYFGVDAVTGQIVPKIYPSINKCGGTPVAPADEVITTDAFTGTIQTGTAKDAFNDDPAYHEIHTAEDGCEVKTYQELPRAYDVAREADLPADALPGSCGIVCELFEYYKDPVLGWVFKGVSDACFPAKPIQLVNEIVPIGNFVAVDDGPRIRYRYDQVLTDIPAPPCNIGLNAPQAGVAGWDWYADVSIYTYQTPVPNGSWVKSGPIARTYHFISLFVNGNGNNISGTPVIERETHICHDDFTDNPLFYMNQHVGDKFDVRDATTTSMVVRQGIYMDKTITTPPSDIQLIVRGSANFGLRKR